MIRRIRISLGRHNQISILGLVWFKDERDASNLNVDEVKCAHLYSAQSGQYYSCVTGRAESLWGYIILDGKLKGRFVLVWE